MTTSTETEFDVAMGEAVFPLSFGMPAARVEDLILSSGPLDDSHVALARAQNAAPVNLGTTELNHVKSLRHSHHRLAQLLALGSSNTEAANITGYTINTISILKGDPAFCELLAFYAANRNAAWSDFVDKAAGIAEDLLEEIADRLHTKPESFSNGQVIEALKAIADRAGHAPVARTHNVNVNLDMGSRLARARERSAAAYVIEQSPAPPSE